MCCISFILYKISSKSFFTYTNLINLLSHVGLDIGDVFINKKRKIIKFFVIR